MLSRCRNAPQIHERHTRRTVSGESPFRSRCSLDSDRKWKVYRDTKSGRMNVGRIATATKTKNYFWKLCQHRGSHRLFLALVTLTKTHQIQASVLQIHYQFAFRRQREIRGKGDALLDRELGFRQNADSLL